MIDTKTGRVTIQQPPSYFEPGLTRTTFASSPIGRQCLCMHSRIPWTTFAIKQTLIGGEVFAVSLCFPEEQIEYVTMTSRREEFGIRLNELTTVKETARQQFHNIWLWHYLEGSTAHNSHGPDMPDWTWSFSWGRFISGWDVKNGTAEIVLRYRHDSSSHP